MRKSECIKRPVRVLRGNCKVKLKLMTKCTGKYQNSPLYRGSAVWDSLILEVQKSLTVLTFAKAICKMHNVYKDLL